MPPFEFWSQGWMSVAKLNLAREWALERNDFIDALQRTHIRINPFEDELIWNKNMVGGNYTAKLGYEALFGTRELGDSWWWRKL